VGSLVLLDGGSAATIAVPTTEAPAYEIAVGELANGRRLFSDDVAFLDHVALLVARRLDELRVAGERYTRDLREHEMRRLTTEAELRALRAQLDPHFLFNALTTIGYLIPNAPRQALDALYRLTALLRGGLRQTRGEFVPLRDELALIDAYLGIEQARFEDRLRVELSIPAELLDLPIPPLILQPIVENAIKHGIAPRRRGGTIQIAAMASDSAPRRLQLRVVDTGAGVAPGELARRRASRVGLSNLERRLDHYFGGDARLVIDSVPGQGTTVDIWLPISGAVITDGPSAHEHLPTGERPRVTAGP
jgi:two-component system sensor histidine kinase LytS